ncbi:hypothetical protein D3C87_1788610 [compost metagenome]
MISSGEVHCSRRQFSQGMSTIVRDNQRTVDIQVTTIITIQEEGICTRCRDIEIATILYPHIFCGSRYTAEARQVHLTSRTSGCRHLVIETGNHAIKIRTGIQRRCFIISKGLVL